jgi:4-hydroxy-tetrahydrodipicolinate synthase
VDAAFAETNPVPVKWIMKELGLLSSDHARAPLAPLSQAARARVRAFLAGSPHVDFPVPVGP